MKFPIDKTPPTAGDQGRFMKLILQQTNSELLGDAEVKRLVSGHFQGSTKSSLMSVFH